MNLEWMALSALLILCIGFMMGRSEDIEVVAWVAVMAAVVLIFVRGYYWNLFGRGEGFWTMNKVSAGAALFGALAAGHHVGTNIRRGVEKYRRERGPSDWVD